MESPRFGAFLIGRLAAGHSEPSLSIGNSSQNFPEIFVQFVH
jgi:hypothetical protein